ncbi:hypothetical protein OBK28_12785 [Empedobacter falsenii]|uniref:DUF4350 domain-containing protein n=1 Tax=Empedobacter falsenii TaxID=343874 RepID=A0ABY8V8H2_9FLAO|nr:hypothetical protein [Empedobacter falsenii]WIH97994.1 hypothetical protein OBA43_03405 [Empedobacter falsenii]
MKKKLSILFGVVLLIGFIAFSMQKLRYDLPKSWKVNLVQNSKDPYGLYVMHKEIGNLSKGKVHDLEKLSELKIDSKKAKDYAVVVIGSEVYFDTVAKNLLSNIARNGGIVFIADYYDNFGDDTNGLDDAIVFDTVYADSTVIEEDLLYNKTQIIKNDFKLKTDKTFKIKKKKEVDHHYFSEITTDSEVIGTITYENKTYPNYLKIKPESYKGFYLYHAEPLYFSNYYLLNEDNYFYAKSVLEPLNGKTIFWYNTSKTYAGSSSMMRFIMAEPALKAAWTTLLILLFLFLIFRSKREQRIIPIYTKEENHTVEFAKTISSLYQENGEVKDIISKKIDYFLYKLRKTFLIDTDNITNKQFIELVAQKANLSQEECLENFTILKNISQKNQPNEHDLKVVYQIIENYKQKANI